MNTLYIYSKILLTAVLALLSTLIYCQSNTISFEYDYDAAGNRISRTIINMSKSCIIDTTFVSEDDNIRQKIANYENLENLEKLETKLEDMRITLYPNPVKELLHVEINGLQDTPKVSYQLIDMNGRIVENNTFNSEKSDISFHNKQSGVYILRLLINGNYKEYKILRD